MSARKRQPIDDASRQATRQRLMNAAGEVFATRGFRAATVREICRRAGANVAAINYHFGDKERLYGELLRFCGGEALQQFPPDLGVKPGDSPEVRLHAFVRSFLLRITDQGRPAWQGKLMAHEMADPTPALDRVVEQVIRPQAMYLAGILRDLLGPAADADLLRRSASSVIGQCIFYFHARAVIERLFPDHRMDRDELENTAAHITRFSLDGLRSLKPGGGPRAASRPAPSKSTRRSKTGGPSARGHARRGSA